MISSFRNFAKTKFAGLLVFLMIIPFVFWGMGSMFSTGNTNSIAKINKIKISTQEFIDYLNGSGIPQETIKNNLDKKIIEELLSGLVSTTLLNLEIEDFELIVSEKTLFQKIKKNKNFLDEDGNFQRMKYEKFLLENNLSAPRFELRLKNRELQKNLFDYIGAGTISPKFMINKLYEEENKKLEIDFINLKNFYTKEEDIKDIDLNKFLTENKEKLKIEYLNFKYAKLNPKNLIGINEFNQSFFDKIDQIEVDVSNDVDFDLIVKDLDITPIGIENFRFSSNKNEIEKKIFELRENEFDIFEAGDDYILYKVIDIEEREPDLNDTQTKKEIIKLVSERNKFNYNKSLLDKIRNNEFNQDDFLKMGGNKIENIKLNSIKDNKKFTINAVEGLYSLPVNSVTLINDENNNLYLARVKKFENELIDVPKDRYDEYVNVQNSNSKNILLKSYDLFLNDKYNVVLNQKTIERVKNFFQ